MRYSITIFFIFLFVGSILSQIQIVDPPKPNYEERITSAVNEIRIIDTHEHLFTEEERLQAPDRIDFTLLFGDYAQADIVSANKGNIKEFIDILYNNNLPLLERWKILEPVYESMRSTSYGRVPLIAARDLYGISDINESTVKELSSRMKKANKKGWYKYVLKEKAKIDIAIIDMGHQKYDPYFYRHVEKFDNFIFVSSYAQIKDFGLKYNMPINSLDDYLKVLRKAFLEGIDYGMVGVKSALAYSRILKYDNVPEEKAKKVFTSILDRSDISPEKVKALQDYLIHRVLDLVNEFDLPIQFHTGLYAGNEGRVITNSNPTHLVNLFVEYPDIDFVLLHSSYPYGGELSTLAKNFPNVFIDMTWSYVISPSYSKRYLHEWIETVPANKILAFGGDYRFVEGVYAHAVMAREVISKVLIEKVRDRYLTENEAINIAKKVLRDNAMRIFNLDNRKSPAAYTMEVIQQSDTLSAWWKLHNSNVGFVRSWKVIGPFKMGAGLDEVYPPERELEFNKSYTGKGGIINWKTENIPSSGYLDLGAIISKRNPDINTRVQGIAYAYTEIISPDDRKVKLTFGSNDGAKVWVNNEVVYKLHVGRHAFADEETLMVNLKKGKNGILVKVENLGDSWGLYLRVIDPKNDLKITQF